ncbi:MAG: hypothetical protein ACYC63_17835 [Armatimonadota bacterium]
MMSRILRIVVLMSMLVAAGAALAMERPTIDSPNSGTALGPNYKVSGSMPYRAFLVVITDCIRTDTGEVIGSVPGIRHWTNNDGRFDFRCASPRVSTGDVGLRLAYRMRCFEIKSNGERGPVAVMDYGMAR